MKEALKNTSLPLVQHSAVLPLLMVCTLKLGDQSAEVQGELDIPLKKRKACTPLASLCVCVCVSKHALAI